MNTLIDKFNKIDINASSEIEQLIEKNYDDIMSWTRKPNVENSLIVEKICSKAERKKAREDERSWGNSVIGKNTCQWTTSLGEGLVKQFIKNKNIDVRKASNKEGMEPDLECECAIIEVKTRNWTTSGTAGEKVPGVPIKYSEVPVLYKKPLWIVCVAYQEWELWHSKKGLFNNLTPNKKAMIDLWKSQNIEFVRFSELGNKLDELI